MKEHNLNLLHDVEHVSIVRTVIQKLRLLMGFGLHL
jgi:hypothetical protein